MVTASPAVSHQLDVIDRTLRTQPDQHLDFLAARELMAEILDLQQQKDALMLGHNYMSPLVYHLSSPDARGDSLGLSRIAARSDHPIIVFNGVRFMAETAKILNPAKKVLIADVDAGCSLADNLTADDARAFRAAHPGAPIVTYINSYATVKAESDYCCTSANAPTVVRHAAREFGTNTVIFLPDTLMGENLQREFERNGEAIELIYPGKTGGRRVQCEVHEQFTAAQLRDIRTQFNMPRGGADTAVLVHWECAPDVLEEADFYGSTSDMARYIAEHTNLRRVYMATECEMAANLASEFPHVEFVRACSFHCPHMRRITLTKLRDCLRDERPEVEVDADIARRARTAIDRMLAIV